MRALGFCVSVAHAEFMARFCNERGLPALALSSESDDEERRTAQNRLRRREVNILFVVDLYNEGVDIPEVDTVVFLRPTESLTVFLQQLGRGLRLHEEKDCLTVIDFIGAHRREFRFAHRFRALSAEPTTRLDHEIESGFPHLPPGCSIRLERVAQQRVLQNVRDSLILQRPRIVQDLRQLGSTLGRAPTLAEALNFLSTSVDELFKRGLWSRLLQDAGLIPQFSEPDEDRLARGIRRIAHLDDPASLRFLLASIEPQASAGTLSDDDQQRLAMLHVSLWGSEGAGWSLDDAVAALRANPMATHDLLDVLRHNLAHTRTRPTNPVPELSPALSLHAHYTRDEALIGLGHWTLSTRPDFREGVLHLPEQKLDAFFITLTKSEDAYSPTTMYEDYAISDHLFHWQSQSTTSADSPTGQRYIHHRDLGYTPILFVRENKHLSTGLASPYHLLGPADYVSHQGSRPISIVWRLRHPMPARLVRATARQAVG